MDLERIRAYAIEGRAEGVQGWLHPTAMTLLIAFAKWQQAEGVVGDVAEIGVHHGRTFCLLKNFCRPEERAFAVDVFENQHLNVDGSGRGDRARFDEAVAVHTDGRGVVVIHADSRTLTPAAFGGRGIRLFSVDGSHTAEATHSDLRLAARCLAPGGAIVLDDIYNPEWPGVQEGFHRFAFEQRDAFTPVFYDPTKIFIVRRADHERVLAFARTLLRHAVVHRPVTVHGSAALYLQVQPPSVAFGADGDL